MSRRTTRTLLALALGSVVLTGCSDGGTPTPAPTTSSESSSSSDLSSPTDEPSETEAAGERMQVPVGSMALPEGWEVDRDNEALATSPSGRSVISLYDLGPVGPVTARQLGRTLVPNAGADDPELGFDVELDGEPGFAVRETDLRDDRAHALFGAVRDGQAVRIGVVLSKSDLPLAEQEAFADELLASYTWAG